MFLLFSFVGVGRGYVYLTPVEFQILLLLGVGTAGVQGGECLC